MATAYTLPAVVYAGNNSTVTAYAIPFPFLEPEYVFAAVTTGATTTELDPTEYTVTQDEDEQGGTLVTDTAVPTTSTITIFRRTARIQPVEYPSAGAFPADSHERALDRLTHIVQELNNAVLELQGDPEAIEVPTDGGAQDLEDTRYFLLESQRDAATPDRIGQLSITGQTKQIMYGTATTAGAWSRCRYLLASATLSGSGPAIQFERTEAYTHALIADVPFTFSSLAAGSRTSILFTNASGALRTITWPVGVKWEGGSAPTTVANGEWLFVDFFSKGTTDAEVYAVFYRSDGGATSVSLTYATTSATSFAIGTGSKAFTVDADLDYYAGDWVSIVSRAAPTADYMIGQVTAYTGTTLTVNVTVTGGSGTKTDWDINLAGRPGATGAAGTSADNSLAMLIEAPTAKTYTVLQYATAAGTISNLIAKLGSGTLTLAVRINGVDVTGLSAVAVTSTESTTAASGANSVAVGDTITVVASSISAPADLAFVIQIT